MKARLPVSEKQLQDATEEYARLAGYLVFHVNDSRRPARRNGRMVLVGDEDTAGFPDLLLLNPRRGDLLVAELKSARGRVTPAQQAWLDAFRAAGVDAYVWRPDDLPAIETRLAGRRPRTEDPKC